MCTSQQPSSGLTNSRPQYRTGGRGPRLGECGRAYGLRTSEEELVACSDDVVEQAKRRAVLWTLLLASRAS